MILLPYLLLFAIACIEVGCWGVYAALQSEPNNL